MTARARYSYIENLVNQILDETGVRQPPVPVDDIIRNKGIGIRYSDLKDVSGVVVRQGDATVIGVNSTQSPVRIRFTLAHELGHALLHKGKEVRFDKTFSYNLRSSVSEQGTDIEEIEANFFAASLLMPRRFIDMDARTHSIDIEDSKALRAISSEYGVSSQAMALRLVYVARRLARSQTQLPF